MPSTIAGAAAVKDVLAELESLGDEKRRQFNAKVGPDGIAGAPADRGRTASASTTPTP